MSSPSYTAILETAQFLRAKGFTGAKVAIVLGTGLGKLLDYIHIEQSLPYEEVPGFPLATVEFHKGRLILGKIGKVKIIAMQGRFHYYEGYSMYEVTFPVRVFHQLGVTHLLLSNAAGGMNPAFKKADLVILEDHINLQPDNPLRGLKDPAFGNRFADMSAPYDAALAEKLKGMATSLGIQLKKGVYVAVPGPNLESRAEYRYLRSMGADMVGMSTVPEVIVANQVGLHCAAISVITDECDPDNLQAVNIADIIAVAGEADQKLSSLLAALVESME